MVDGRWIAEVAEIPGAMKYGKSKAEAIALGEALAFRAIAEGLESVEAERGPRRNAGSGVRS